MDLLSPDDIRELFNSPFVSMFWPTIIGGLILFVVLIRGARFLMFMVFILTAFVQAWNLGFFGAT